VNGYGTANSMVVRREGTKVLEPEVVAATTACVSNMMRLTVVEAAACPAMR